MLQIFKLFFFNVAEARQAFLVCRSGIFVVGRERKRCRRAARTSLPGSMHNDKVDSPEVLDCKQGRHLLNNFNNLVHVKILTRRHFWYISVAYFSTQQRSSAVGLWLMIMSRFLKSGSML
jgi:hypothetical protein